MPVESAPSKNATTLLDKKVVNYRQGTGNKRCDRCAYFLPPTACRRVAGDIQPTGLCDLFLARQLDTELFGGDYA